MAEVAELVTEFRGIIDKIVSQRDAEEKRRRSYSLSMDRGVAIAGLVFGSYKKSDGRSSVFGHGTEQLWGVRTENYRVERRTGRLAVVSIIESPELLFRRWSFDSAMQMIDVKTSRTIDDPAEMASVLEWVKSPHLNDDVLQKLTVLEPSEEEKVAEGLGELAAKEQELQEGLAEIARARRAPLPDIIIG
jgi:hypothetical protein